MTSSPTVTSTGAGKLWAFVRGTDGHVWSRYFNVGWSDWFDMGTTTAAGTSPVAVSRGEDAVDLFTYGEDGIRVIC